MHFLLWDLVCTLLTGQRGPNRNLLALQQQCKPQHHRTMYIVLKIDYFRVNYTHLYLWLEMAYMLKKKKK